MHRLPAIVLTCVAVWFTASASAQPRVQASIDRTEVTVNEPFLITIRAQGPRVADPVIPHSPDIRFDRSPLTQSSQTMVSMVNGQATMMEIKERSYRAWAQRAGQLTMPRIQVRIDGEVYMTDELTITAVELDPNATLAQPQRPQRPGNNAAPQAAPRTPTLDDIIRIETETDKQKAYQGEQVTLTLRILKLANPTVMAQYEGRSIPLPSTEGFFAGPLADREYMDARDGLNYMVTEYTQFLYPTGPGEVTIGSWVWQGMVRGTVTEGDRQRPVTAQRSLQTDPIMIEVRPLPQRPAEFSGAVGAFNVRANLRDGAPTQGVPTLLVLRVEGHGNPAAIDAPPLPAIPWAHVGDPEVEMPNGTADQTGRIVKTFSFPITPLQAGEQSIPEIRFVYFEPKIGNYRTETIQPIPVFVKPSTEDQQLVAVGGTERQGTTSIEVLGEDLAPIVTAADPLRPRRSGVPVNTAVGVVPPVACCAFLLYLRRQRKLQDDPAYARTRFARAKSKQRLQHMHDAKEPVEELYRAVAGYVGDKFNIEASGMTSADVRTLLRERGIDEALADGITRILRNCERERYAAAKLAAPEVQALLEAAELALEELDHAITEGRRR
jgi:hypothetical protein